MLSVEVGHVEFLLQAWWAERDWVVWIKQIDGLKTCGVSDSVDDGEDAVVVFFCGCG